MENTPVIRELHPEDSDQLLALMETREELDPEGAKKRVELMKWMAFHNPHASNGETTYFAVEDQGRIVAFHGRMPTYFNINGERTKGYFVHDLYVDPQYRKMGKGFWLTIALAKAIEEDSKHFFCLFGMTPLNLQMQRRRKYFETNTDVYWKILNPIQLTSRKIKVSSLSRLAAKMIGAGIWFLDTVTSGFLLKKTKISKIDRFDERFDQFMERVSTHTGFHTYKDSSYLNWKYIDRPYRLETIYAVEEDQEVKGYVVLAVQTVEGYTTGRIIDLMADPQDHSTILSLIKKSIDYFRGEKANSINCIVSDPKIKHLLKKFKFYQGKGSGGRKTVMLGNLQYTEPYQNALTNIENWHFTESESDALMLKFS